MLLKELIPKIDLKETPIIYHDTPNSNGEYCYSRTATSDELAKLRNQDAKNILNEELGVHIVDADIQQVFNNALAKTGPVVREICDMLADRCSVKKEQEKFAYVLFTILHEIGHWQHLKQSGLSGLEYWKKYETGRDSLWINYQFIYNCMCTNDAEREVATIHFNREYRKLPSEEFADEYAIGELPKYLDVFQSAE